MKKGMYLKGSILAVLSSVVLLTACGNTSDSVYKEQAFTGGAYDSYGVYENSTASMADAPMEEAAEGESSSVGEIQNTENRKLITTVNLTAETEDFTATIANIETKVSELGGYIESSNVYNGNYTYGSGSRSANLTVRVPSDKLSEFVDSVEGATNIVQKSVDVQDITLSYVDTQSRKNALKTEEKRLLEILESAETVEDLITVEDKLADVRYELESIESQLRSYDNKVDYSTVYLNVEEVTVYTPVQEESMFTRMGKGFKESLGDVGDGIVDFLVEFVSHIPQIVVFIVVVFIIYLIVKAFIKSYNKRKAKKMAKLQAEYAARMNAAQNSQPKAAVMPQTANDKSSDVKTDRGDNGEGK